MSVVAKTLSFDVSTLIQLFCVSPGHAIEVHELTMRFHLSF